MSAEVVCPGCANPIEAPPPWQPHGFECGLCHARGMVLVGAARPTAKAMPAEPALAGAATCFFHAENAASVACASCGRFLCQLCDIELESGHQCPICFETATAANAIASVRQREVMYDSMALSLSWAWVLLYFTWIAAFPTVVYLSVKHWHAPRHYLLPRSPWRFAMALLLVSLPLLLVGGALLAVWATRRSGV